MSKIINKKLKKEVLHFPATEDENEINVCSWIEEEESLPASMFGREVSPPKCPTCGHPLNLGRYSPKRSTDEYGDWYWDCEGCGYLRWTVFEKETKTVQEIIEEYESTRRNKNISGLTSPAIVE